MFQRADKIIGTKDYINYRLTGRIATDPSYALGTGVYDLLAWDYSDDLLAELPAGGVELQARRCWSSRFSVRTKRLRYRAR